MSSLGYYLGATFSWQSSPEGIAYWGPLNGFWMHIRSRELDSIFEPYLALPASKDLAWPHYKDTPAYNKFCILATYRERFGQDAPIDLMIELVKDNGESRLF